jgi:hypothetical protein
LRRQPNFRRLSDFGDGFLEVGGFVAAQTGIPHRSPQVLAMQNGIVMRHASYQKITHDFLKTLTQA